MKINNFIKNVFNRFFLANRQNNLRYYDIELTNKCNARCTFCPRDKTPSTGFMEHEALKKTVQRIIDHKKIPKTTFCGLGEPLLHPDIVKFVSYLTENNIYSAIDTNAYLLKKDMSHKLIDAGLKRLSPSISSIDEAYKKIHGFDFETIKTNILDFVEASNNECEIILSMTICDENKNDIKFLKQYWKKLGVTKFLVFDKINRGGALPMDYNFINNNKYINEAKKILEANNIRPICYSPFAYTFIGWDGNYYMCCHDYEKKMPLGNVFEHSISEIDTIKEKLVMQRPAICHNCDIDTINRVREVLFRIDQEKATREDLDKTIAKYKSIKFN